MPITINEEKLNKYPLTLDDLEEGQIAEHSNGTVVIKAGGEAWNLANGFGGYSFNVPNFRLLTRSVIKLETNADAKAGSYS